MSTHFDGVVLGAGPGGCTARSARPRRGCAPRCATRRREDRRDAATTGGTQADQWPDSACTCQLWTFHAAAGSAWTLQNVNSGLDLDIARASTAAGAAVVQNPASGAASQKWSLLNAGGGYYKLVDAASGLAAGVGGSSTTPGAGIIQWTNVNVDDQLWQIVRLN